MICTFCNLYIYIYVYFIIYIIDIYLQDVGRRNESDTNFDIDQGQREHGLQRIKMLNEKRSRWAFATATCVALKDVEGQDDPKHSNLSPDHSRSSFQQVARIIFPQPLKLQLPYWGWGNMDGLKPTISDDVGVRYLSLSPLPESVPSHLMMPDAFKALGKVPPEAAKRLGWLSRKVTETKLWLRSLKLFFCFFHFNMVLYWWLLDCHTNSKLPQCVLRIHDIPMSWWIAWNLPGWQDWIHWSVEHLQRPGLPKSSHGKKRCATDCYSVDLNHGSKVSGRRKLWEVVFKGSWGIEASSEIQLAALAETYLKLHPWWGWQFRCWVCAI